jgi:hypothetical protein
MNPGVGGAVFAWLATGWTVGQARWAVGARAALIPAAGFLFCLATMMSLFFTSAADVPTWRLLTNLAAVSRDFCMIAWFLFALYPQPTRARRLFGGQLLVLGLTVVTALSSWSSAPARVFVAVTTSRVHGLAPGVFVASIETYHLYALALCAVCSIVYAYRAKTTAARWGLIGFTAGFTLLWIIAILHVTPVAAAALQVSRFPDPQTYLPPKLLSGLGYALMLAGVSVPVLVSLVKGLPGWRAHRIAYRDLRPLFCALRQGMPGWVTGRRYPSWGERVWPRRTHRRFYLRLTRIWDGLVQIQPWYDRDLGVALAHQARASGRDEHEARAWAHAGMLDAALRAKAAGAPARAAPVTEAIEPRAADGPTLREEIRWLVALSRAYANYQLAKRPVCPSAEPAHQRPHV